MRELPADLALQLLKDARLKPPEVDDRRRRAVDAAYWRGLIPELHVDNDIRELRSPAIAPQAVDAAARAIHDKGVFQLTGAIAPATIAQLNTAIDRVVAAGWPAVFAFVYDEFWLCARTPAIARIATAVLGPGVAQIPHVWVHLVQPSEDASGWAPHVDGVGQRRLSSWVALTDATLDNGCMHVVPRHLAPPRLAERFDARETFTGTELIAALHAATAMPASAGDVLGWAFDVVHWGGHARGGGAARRSLSFEYIAAAETPADDERPVLPLVEDPPPLAARLRAIANGVLEYRKFEPMLTRFEDLARRMLEDGPSSR